MAMDLPRLASRPVSMWASTTTPLGFHACYTRDCPSPARGYRWCNSELCRQPEESEPRFPLCEACAGRSQGCPRCGQPGGQWQPATEPTAELSSLLSDGSGNGQVPLEELGLGEEVGYRCRYCKRGLRTRDLERDWYGEYYCETCWKAWDGDPADAALKWWTENATASMHSRPRKYSGGVSFPIGQEEEEGRRSTREAALRDFVKVTRDDTLTAASHHPGSDTCALVFASNERPGGANGALSRRQIGDFCRHSTYQVLFDYTYGGEGIFPLQPNDVLYCSDPGIHVFSLPNNQELPQPFALSVVASEPIRVRDMRGLSDEEVRRLIEQKIRDVLHVCVLNERRRLILGAWGCGPVGRNSPHHVSQVFASELQRLRDYFDLVVFAVPDEPTWQVFSDAFS